MESESSAGRSRLTSLRSLLDTLMPPPRRLPQRVDVTMSKLSHIDAHGRAQMVDVADKAVTSREAIAIGIVRMKPEVLRMIVTGQIPKGDVLAVARIAGIMAAKKTPELIPLCHPLPISKVTVDFELGPDTVDIFATVKTRGVTGVEMEALTAASVAALSVYDMIKAVDKHAVLT